MAATATLIVGIARDVMTWPDYSLAQLAAHGIPVVRGFVPVPHSSRKGWVAKDECYPANPFTCDVDRDRWTLQSGENHTLREMAGRTVRAFWKSISELGDPTSLRLIASVMRGRAPSLLELDDRPAAYDDVGRLCSWNDLFPVTLLPRSRYERVLSNAIAGRRVRIAGAWHRPVGVRGWTHVVLRRERDGTKHIRSLDDLLVHLDAWDRSANRRLDERRLTPPISILAERRVADRRVDGGDTLERRRESDRVSESAAPNDTLDVTLNGDTPSAAGLAKSRVIRPAAEAPLVIIARI